MDKSFLPVGVFDSGIGGVSVLRQMTALMPQENFIYLGDTANAPYGTKSHDEIMRLSVCCAEYLVLRGIKALVVACNTATSVCIDHLRARYPHMDIVGIEPAIKPALECKDNSVIAVMATPLTLKEEKFANLTKELSASSRIVPLPCPGLMEIVESGLFNDKEAYKYLRSLFDGVDIPDAVVLGCTHYPFVRPVIEELLPGVRIYDGGEGTARQLKRVMEAGGIMNPTVHPGRVEFINTSEDEAANKMAELLLSI